MREFRLKVNGIRPGRHLSGGFLARVPFVLSVPILGGRDSLSYGR